MEMLKIQRKGETADPDRITNEMTQSLIEKKMSCEKIPEAQLALEELRPLVDQKKALIKDSTTVYKYEDLEVDAVPRPHRQRPKDSFQKELHSKLKQRKSLGLAADITDSDEDAFNPFQAESSKKFQEQRPGSAKRRENRSPDLSSGLGTTTLRTRDLKKLLSHDTYDDDDDDEEVASTFAKTKPLGSYQPPSGKLPSPKEESKFLKKSTKKPSNPSETIFGKKTPTNDTFSKEDIIFGRKTPTDSKKSPTDWSQKDKSWQPPNFRTVSPNSPVDQHRGSHGVTPEDSMLESISETPKEKITPRLQRGLKEEISPRQSSLDGKKPVPQARSKDVSRTSPSFKKDADRYDNDRDSLLTSKTSTFDYDRSRNNSKLDSEKRLASPTHNSDKKRATPTFGLEKKRTTPTFDSNEKRTSPTSEINKKRATPIFDSNHKGTSPTSEINKKRASPTFDTMKKRTSPTFESEKKKSFDLDKRSSSPSLDFFGRSRADSKLELDSYIVSEKDKKHDYSRAASGDRQKYSKTEARADSKTKPGASRVTFNNKKDQASLKTDQLGRKSPLQRSMEEDESRNTASPSLMDLITDKPKPPARTSKLKTGGQSLSDDFKTSLDGRKSPSPVGRKSPETLRKPLSEHSLLGEMSPTKYQQQKPEDTSSLCEELPPDPNRLLEVKKEEKGKHGTERFQNDNLIDSVAGAQSQTILGQSTKRVRPVTANAKVQHRPKPRYGLLPGQTTSLKEKQFNSTGDIREAVYEEWYKEHLKVAIKKKQEEEKKKQEEEEKKKKEAEQKKQESELSYQSWAKEKNEKLLTVKRAKEEEEKKKKKKEEREKEDKKIESEKSFESWKKNKEVVIKKQRQIEAKKKREEEEEKERLEREKKVKMSVYIGWEKKKEKDEEQKRKQQTSATKSEQQKRIEEREAIRKKEEESREKYYKWLEEKEKQAKKEKQKAKQRQLSGEEEYKPAWFPASHTIPFGR